MKFLLVLLASMGSCLAMDNPESLESYVDVSSVANLPSEKLDAIFQIFDIKDKRTLIRTHQDQVFAVRMNKIVQDSQQKFDAHERLMAREYRTVQWLKGLLFLSSCSMIGTSIYWYIARQAKSPKK